MSVQMEDTMAFNDYDDENNPPPKKPPGVTGGCGAGLGGPVDSPQPGAAPEETPYGDLTDDPMFHPQAG